MKRIVLCLLLVVGFAMPIAPSAFAADTNAPVLLDWKLIDLKTDISNGDGILRIQFSVSDESDISDPLSNVGSTTTTQQTGFAFPNLISKVGNVSTYSAEATVKFGQAPGLWRWLFFPLRDALGNSSQSFGPSGSWPINVWVYDKEFTEAKRLTAEAAAAKAAADAKAIADKAAAEAKAIGDAKAAADKATAEKAAAEAKAIADKAAAEAKAIADKAAAEAKAIGDAKAAADKATAEKAAAEAKAIADKAAADANRREQTIRVTPFRTGSVSLSSIGLPTSVNSTSNLSVFAYNSTNKVCVFENGMIRTKTSGRCVIAFSQEGNSEFKPASNLILEFTITDTTKKTTITCTKGKLTKKITAVKPKCPAGYKVKK